MDVIETIENANLEITNQELGLLKEPIKIEKATVDTKGYKYTVKKITK